MRIISKKVYRILTYALMALFVLIVLMFIKAWIDGKFNSSESLKTYMEGFGVFAPFALIVFQAVQVVIPILPGFLGCAVGALMFGANVGFWCNYIGISLGSIIAFMLAKKFGSGFVEQLFSNEKYNKWAERAGYSKSYTAFLFVAMLLPLFPDDYLCYLSGLTKMTLKRFTWIIILGKPWCLLAYSIGFSFISF